MGERRITYTRLQDLVPAERNPKKHNIAHLVNSIQRYGFGETPMLDARTNRLVAGHGRDEALRWIQTHEPDSVPEGIKVDTDGEWLVPVQTGWASRNDTEAEGYLMASNNLTTSGGWDLPALAEVLGDVICEDAGLFDTLGWTSDDLDELLARTDPDVTVQPTPDLSDPFADDDPDPDDDDDDDAGGEPDPAPERVTCPDCHLEFAP